MKFNYILKRILIAIPTFLGITLLSYVLSSLAPGSPLDALLADPKITTAELARRQVELGLDKSVLVQYFSWLKQLLQGNLGYSFSSNRLPVAQLIAARLKPTLLLAGFSFAFSLIVAIPLGVFAASKPNSMRDYLSSGISFLLVGTPNFFAGLALIYIFGVVLKILPTGGMYDSSGNQTTLDLLRHLILPMLVLSFQQIGSWIRYMRSSMVEVFQEDYLRTARAKGLRPFAVIRKHAFKNSLLPVITVIGMSIPGLVGGAVVTEQVFSWPGVGSLMIQSIAARDYPTIMGITVLVAITVLVINLITDLVYGMLDPRISYR
jgi:peptide/nickel transport system permease protein